MMVMAPGKDALREERVVMKGNKGKETRRLNRG